MLSIAPQIYVDKSMPKEQQQKLLQTVKASRQEVRAFFGSAKANPTIYACSTILCAQAFGGISAKAKAMGDSKVLLSKKGLDSTTLTHELVHIELHKRIGSQKAWHKIPMWFDEGLAVMVCNDKRYAKNYAKSYTENKKPSISLDELVTQQQWIDAVKQGKRPYRVAKEGVQEWYRSNGHQALDALIARMKRGEKFSLADTKQVIVHKSYIYK